MLCKQRGPKEEKQDRLSVIFLHGTFNLHAICGEDPIQPTDRNLVHHHRVGPHAASDATLAAEFCDMDL